VYVRRLACLFSASHPLSDAEAQDQWVLWSRAGGPQLAHRLVHYIKRAPSPGDALARRGGPAAPVTELPHSVTIPRSSKPQAIRRASEGARLHLTGIGLPPARRSRNTRDHVLPKRRSKVRLSVDRTRGQARILRVVGCVSADAPSGSLPCWQTTSPEVPASIDLLLAQTARSSQRAPN